MLLAVGDTGIRVYRFGCAVMIFGPFRGSRCPSGPFAQVASPNCEGVGACCTLRCALQRGVSRSPYHQCLHMVVTDHEAPLCSDFWKIWYSSMAATVGLSAG